MEIVSALEKHFKIELDVKYRYVKIYNNKERRQKLLSKIEFCSN